MIRLIAAVDKQLGIAKNGEMPWHIPEDEAYFTKQTKKFGGHVLTGGATFREAYKNRPLAGRRNYLLTRDKSPIDGVELVHDLSGFLQKFIDNNLWVAGGAEVFKQIIDLGMADELYLTHIDDVFGCDRFFPEYDKDFELIDKSQPHQQNGFRFYYARYRRKPT